MALPLTLRQVQQQQGVIIDTRNSALFNGWPMGLTGTSGHEPGAWHLASDWLDKMDDEALLAWSASRCLTPNSVIALYGEGCERVAERLRQSGLNAAFILSDALTEPSRLVSLPGFRQRVPLQWLHQLMHGKPVAAKPAGEWRVIEVITGEINACVHIPGTAYLDIRQLESGPLWNVVPPLQLRSVLEAQAIRSDTPVILYGHNLLATARAAHILLYAGVEDVRMLDGNPRVDAFCWQHAGAPATSPPADFGKPVPAQPKLLINRVQAQGMLQREDAALVSIRSWQEHSGQVSGYAYISAQGDIPGARWGHAGQGKNGMQDFLNPDGTLRSAEEITAMWQAQNITPEQDVAFYCGTGWRASLAFMCARAMGWPRIAVYDGGWFEWSQFYE